MWRRSSGSSAGDLPALWETAMTGQVTEFARALRDAGVRVSLAEALDACRALEHLSLERRADLRLALRCALIKDPADFPTFDLLFEKYFRCHWPRRKQRESRPRTFRHEGAAPRPGGSQPGTRPAPPRPEPERKRDGKQPLNETDARKGERAPDQREERSEEERWLAEWLADLEEGMGEARREGLRELRQRRSDLRRLDLTRRLEPEDARQVAEAVEKLARKLASRESLRRRRARRGKVDLKATLARSARTGGVPFHIERRRRTVAKTKLLLLCDVSGSVWRVAAFLLRLIHHLQNQFARTHSLVFVDRPVDVSELLARYPFEDALARIRDIPDLNLNAYSDFGNTFYELLDDYAPLLDRDTVLLVLGDARTNQFEPMEWALADLRQRIRRVVWLNPEPPERWNTGDSVIRAYAPFCGAVLPCATLEDLEEAARLLLSDTRA
ncbi:MAG: VWA domain-containing protein [Armatimonadetes bacterium]|nr:VWA domain-containing protein [Armatimonadota bacterium]